MSSTTAPTSSPVVAASQAPSPAEVTSTLAPTPLATTTTTTESPFVTFSPTTPVPTQSPTTTKNSGSSGFGEFLVIVFLIVLFGLLFRLVKQRTQRNRDAQQGQQEGIEFGHVPEPVQHGRVETV